MRRIGLQLFQCVPLRGGANTRFQRNRFRLQQSVLGPEHAPDVFENTMQDRATIDRLHSQTHPRQLSRDKSYLGLRTKRTSRLQFDRTCTAAGAARWQCRRTIVTETLEYGTLEKDRIAERHTLRFGACDLVQRKVLQKRTACELHIAAALGPAQHQRVGAMPPSPELRPRVIQHRSGRGFEYADSALQLERN